MYPGEHDTDDCELSCAELAAELFMVVFSVTSAVELAARLTSCASSVGLPGEEEGATPDEGGEAAFSTC